MVLNEKTLEEMSHVTGIDQLPPDLAVAIFDKFGSDIMSVAISKFLETQGEWEQTAFENWVTQHAQDTDILANLVTLYPMFGKILTEEIISFSTMVTQGTSVA